MGVKDYNVSMETRVNQIHATTMMILQNYGKEKLTDLTSEVQRIAVEHEGRLSKIEGSQGMMKKLIWAGLAILLGLLSAGGTGIFSNIHGVF
jgi:hypothetical protein